MADITNYVEKHQTFKKKPQGTKVNHVFLKAQNEKSLMRKNSSGKINTDDLQLDFYEEEALSLFPLEQITSNVKNIILNISYHPQA